MKISKFIENPSDFSNNLGIELIKKILVFDDLNSTNNKAKQLAIEGEDEGTIVISRIQKRGKGRFNREWESPEGGMYLSIILKPDILPEKSTLLSLISAIAISRTVSSLGLSPEIKWPNDVRINKKKIAGILIESEVCQEKIKYVVVGIGINLNIHTQNLSENIKKLSTSILDEIDTLVDYSDFLKNLLNNFDKYYKMFLDEKYDEIIREWKNHSDTINQKIVLDTNTKQLKGKIVDINEFGFLKVILETGEIRIINSGEIFFIEN